MFATWEQQFCPAIVQTHRQTETFWSLSGPVHIKHRLVLTRAGSTWLRAVLMACDWTPCAEVLLLSASLTLAAPLFTALQCSPQSGRTSLSGPQTVEASHRQPGRNIGRITQGSCLNCYLLDLLQSNIRGFLWSLGWGHKSITEWSF